MSRNDVSRYSKPSGFTIVEIIIAVAILAILTTIGLVVFRGQEQAARITKVQQDMIAMAREIEIVREARNQVFFQLIGDDAYADRFCRDVPGSVWPSGTKVKDRSDCINEIKTDWSTFTTMPLPTDPWGNIYTFDANEYEPDFHFENNSVDAGPNRYCRWDVIKSAGPDGISWTADDYIYYVSPKICAIKEECYLTPGIVLGGRRNDPIDTTECADPNPAP